MSRLRAPQDSCWDKVCPGYKKEEKLNCLYANKSGICDCCKTANLSDCEVLVPDYGLFDACGDNEPEPGPEPRTKPRTESVTLRLQSSQGLTKPVKIGIGITSVVILAIIIGLIVWKKRSS